MPPAYLNDRHSGNLVARSVSDVQEVEDFIAHGIPETMLAIVIPITMSVVLFLLNWKLALIALAPLPVVAAVAYFVKKKTVNSWWGVRKKFAGLSATMQDHLAGLSTVQSFTAEASAAKRLERESRDYRDNIIHANAWSLVPAGIVEAASGAGMVLLIVAGLWMSGTAPALDVDIAELIVFVMYLGQIFLPFLRLANLTEQLHKSSASAMRVFELLDTPSTIVDAPDAIAPESMSYEIEYDAVDFSYAEGVPVLRNLSLRVPEGTSAALVGVTGVGKTTACHLLLRFYEADAGEVRIGGHDVRRLKLEFLRKQIALVSQDVFLFQGTIRENLLLGNEQATDDELRAAIEAAHCVEFIDTFPNGLDTVVGERGVRLSGGQKQRVAIARALLKDAPILVLDEATSAVDAETESLIRDALERVTAGRTVLIVAHRQSTIQAADQIALCTNRAAAPRMTFEADDRPRFSQTFRMSDHQNLPWVERPTIRVDADVPLERRFQQLGDDVRSDAATLLRAVRENMPVGIDKLVTPVRVRTLNRFQKEFVALANLIGADWKDVLLANVSYDLVIAAFGCSAVALPTATGPVLARNMDWWPEDILARASYIVQTERGGELQYANAGWPGAVGVVTGMSGRGFAVSLNAVISPDGFSRLGYPVLLHLRRVVEDAADFDDALERLSRQKLTVPGLFTLVGRENDQRVVIERAPNRFALRWGEPGTALVTTNDYRKLYKTETHDSAEIYRTTCMRYDTLTRAFSGEANGGSDVNSESEVTDEHLLYLLSDPAVIQSITAQHIILRPGEGTVRLFVPRRFVEAP
eukprot:g5280.t1